MKWRRAHAIEEYAAAIRALGPEHCIVSSDLGQPDNPLSPDSLVAYTKTLQEEGFIAEAEIDQMVKKNPATLLGFPRTKQLPNEPFFEFYFMACHLRAASQP